MTTRPTPRNPSSATFAHSGQAAADDGSVTPLIIGMMLCLLLLGAGVTTAGSAFLAGQRLQHVCDGAAAAAAGALTDNPATNPQAIEAMNTYLAVRGNPTDPTITLQGTTITLTCRADTPITFGALFATPTLHRIVTSTARTYYQRG